MKSAPRPQNVTYSEIVSTMALFVALGGVSYAAIVLPRDSVGKKQLKDRSVGADELAPSSVSTPALTPEVRRAIRSGAEPRTFSASKSLGPNGAGVPQPAGSSVTAEAICPKGSLTVGGGYAIDGPGQIVSTSAPAPDGVRWSVTFSSVADGASPGGTAYVVCVHAPPAR